MLLFVPFFIIVGSADASEKDAGNSILEATPIILENGSATVDGEISNVSDMDFYKFTLTTPGKVDIGINRSLNTQYRVTLFDKFKRELEIYETLTAASNGVEPLFSQGLDEGTYYVKVEFYKGVSENIPYKLGVKFTSSNVFEKEENNSRGSANAIALNTKYSGWADLDNDYYVFKLPSNGEVKIDLTQSSKTKFEIALINIAGEEMEKWMTNYSTGQVENIIHTGLPEGTYYVRIKSVEGDLKNAPYDFIVHFTANLSFETENNNSSSLANEIAFGEAIRGVISSNKDTDYYRLLVTDKTNLDIFLTQPKDTTFKVKISNQSSTIDKDLVTEYGNGTLTKIGNLDLLKGIYTISVQHYQGENRRVPYVLKVGDAGSGISTFKDYRAGEYWVESFEWGIRNNILKGDPKTNRLNPNRDITEAQWLAMLLRYALPNEAKDAADGNWFESYYLMAGTRGIGVTGKPNNPLRRGNVATMLEKVYSGQNLNEYDAVQWLFDKGITTGVDPSKPKNFSNFNPDGLITRAQAITFMHRLEEGGIKPSLR